METENSEPEKTAAPDAAGKKKLGNLASRFLVALVAVPILLVAIYQPYHAITWALVYLVAMIAVDEFFAMMMPERDDRFGPLVISGAVVAGFYWLPLRYNAMAVMLAVLVGAFILPALYFLFRKGDIKTVATRMMSTTVGIIYAGILLSFLALMRRDFGHDESHMGADLIILVLGSAWLSDTGGYFAGKSLGRHKLYPSVSPNKTWEGSIGGVAAVALGAVAFKLWLAPEIPWHHVMLLAIPAAIIGQVGDLAESLLKRSVGVKDSGALLPGHGGILDRVDAVLFIAPYVYLYLAFSM